MAKKRYFDSEFPRNSARLPEKSFIKPLPRVGGFGYDGGLGDTMAGIDEVMKSDGSKIKKYSMKY